MCEYQDLGTRRTLINLKVETFAMDGDDDLFAVFDADENAEDIPSKPSPSGQVLVMLICILS